MNESVIRHEASYDAAGCDYVLTSKQFPDAALWMTLSRHSPAARITLLSVPENRAGLALAQALLSEAINIAKKSKARTCIKTKISLQTSVHFKTAGFRKVGEDYMLDLYSDQREDQRA